MCSFKFNFSCRSSILTAHSNLKGTRMKKEDWFTKGPKLLWIAPALLSLLAGCGQVVNNNLQVNTALGKYTTGGPVLSPLGSQPVAGQWVADIPASSSLNPNQFAPAGTNYSIQGVTDPWLGVIVLDQWPTYLLTYNDRMPAYWNFEWEHPPYCVDPSTPPYGPLPNPYDLVNQVELPSLSAYTNPVQGFNCFINSPANPDFDPTEVTPQVVLDDALPSTIQVHAFSPISAVASVTHLRLFSMSLTNPANVTAISVATDGSNAVFPYPRSSSGSSLPAGPYLTTITTDPQGEAQTTNGMEPIYIAHDDTSYTSAFGVDVAVPAEHVTTIQHSGNQYGPCEQVTVTQSNYGGSTLPLVTLPAIGELAVGSSSNTIPVGLNPTVVLAYNSMNISNTQVTDSCGSEIITNYSGAQSALVVNTGSNSVSLLNIGQYSYPSGTVTVGTSPVAAVINPAGTFAYVANYGSGTISEVSLQNARLNRTLSVMQHPTSAAFDYNGNLWVGGQGYLQLISTTSWSVSSTFYIDGTVTGMTYDTAQGAFVATVLKNGRASSPVSGQTMSAAVAFSPVQGSSYSTTSLVNVASGNSSSSTITGDASPYAGSSIANLLAFPGQTAFNPPVYSSASGDIVATANGTTFTVSALASGKVLISGSTPHPIRGVRLTSTMLYLTMSESNSLVTLPLQLP